MFVKIGDAWFNPDEITAISLPSDMKDPAKIIVTLRQGVSVWPDATMDEAEAALIDAGYIENPYPEEDEPPELTEKEREVLTGLYDQDFEYLARDKDGKLYAFHDKPEKEGAYWNTHDGRNAMRIDEGFDFIDFVDEKPWSIAYLLLD